MTTEQRVFNYHYGPRSTEDLKRSLMLAQTAKLEADARKEETLRAAKKKNQHHPNDPVFG